MIKSKKLIVFLLGCLFISLSHGAVQEPPTSKRRVVTRMLLGVGAEVGFHYLFEKKPYLARGISFLANQLWLLALNEAGRNMYNQFHSQIGAKEAHPSSTGIFSRDGLLFPVSCFFNFLSISGMGGQVGYDLAKKYGYSKYNSIGMAVATGLAAGFGIPYLLGGVIKKKVEQAKLPQSTVSPLRYFYVAMLLGLKRVDRALLKVGI